MNIKIYLLFLFWLLMCSSSLNAQKYNIKSYSIEEGLGQSQVLDIYQDKRGFLWFGTNGGGVSRFDGNSFENFSTKTGLINNIVNVITEDSSGNIWIGTHEGLSVYNGIRFKNYSTRQGLINKKIHTICRDNDDVMWVGTQNGISLLQLSPDERTINSLETLTKEKGLLDNAVYSIIKDKRGNIWMATREGVSRYNRNAPDNKLFRHFTAEDGLVDNFVNSIKEDTHGNLWITTINKGISKLILSDKTQEFRFQNFTTKNGLKSNMIWDVLIDKNENVWIAQWSGGVIKLTYKDTDQTNYYMENYTMKNGLPDDNIWSLCEDFEGNIWIGTYGGGACRYSGKVFETYTIQDGLADDFIWSVMEDESQNLWVGTDFGGISKFIFNNEGALKTVESLSVKKGLIGNRIYHTLEDRSKNIWVSTSNGAVKIQYNKESNSRIYKYYTTLEGLPDNDLRIIFEDSKGNIWFGTNNYGVSKLNFDIKQNVKPRFQHFSTSNGLIYNSIFSIKEDNDGNIWVATGGGVSKLTFLADNSGRVGIRNYSAVNGLASDDVRNILIDKSGNIWFGTGGGVSKLYYVDNSKSEVRFKNFTFDNGLSSGRVYLMIFDNNENLWIGTNIGVDKFDVREYNKSGKMQFQHYGYAEGFKGIETNTNAVCKDRKGNLWFGTIDGLIKYNHNEDVPYQIAPRVHITQMRILTEKFDMGKELELDFNQNHITFDYIGISYNNSESVRCQYKLEGLDYNWSFPTHENHVTYSNLPPGEYTFMVKAINGENNRSSLASYAFVVTPPLWRMWWFYILCFILFSSLLYGIYRIRIRNLQKIKRELLDKVRLRTSQLNKQNQILEDLNNNLAAEKEKVEHFAEELKRSNKDLQGFAFIASHDLKEPLRKISFFLERLTVTLNTQLDEKSIDYMKRVLSASMRMKTLIDDLLKYSRVTTKQQPLETTDLNKIISDVMSDLEVRINETKARIEVDDLPVIKADKLQMRQLFQNLVSNALKFHKKDVPPVIKIENKQIEGRFYEIIITDNGIGFDQKFASKIFEPFYRLHTRTEYEGTGIGTAICYKIVKRHKGDIFVQSSVNEGTTFIIKLPQINKNS